MGRGGGSKKAGVGKKGEGKSEGKREGKRKREDGKQGGGKMEKKNGKKGQNIGSQFPSAKNDHRRPTSDETPR